MLEEAVFENSEVTHITLSIIATEVSAITLALTWIAEQSYSTVISESLAGYSRESLKKVYRNWYVPPNPADLHSKNHKAKLPWIYCSFMPLWCLKQLTSWIEIPIKKKKMTHIDLLSSCLNCQGLSLTQEYKHLLHLILFRYNDNGSGIRRFNNA